jgi:hypothetical protein
MALGSALDHLSCSPRSVSVMEGFIWLGVCRIRARRALCLCKRGRHAFTAHVLVLVLVCVCLLLHVPYFRISAQARGPAEFKHIIKRRKRN